MPTPLPVRQALISAGANLGDRLENLRGALARLAAAPGIMSITSSAVYETDPVGKTDQPLFLNLAAGLTTTLSPEALLKVLQETEQAFGRVRHERWGPRTLDLDLLAVEDETRSTDELMLPHPRMLERAFVLVPLADVLDSPDFLRPCWASLRRHTHDIRLSPNVRRVATEIRPRSAKD